LIIDDLEQLLYCGGNVLEKNLEEMKKTRPGFTKYVI
jgi:hypothetical protein